MISNLPDRIFLCGFMGTGKTTIGRLLARKLESSFLDLDDRIEQAAGKSIPHIFEQDGEAEFRKLERSCLLDVIRTFEGIVALGGGTLQNQYLVDHIKLNGLLIFIETPFSVIFKRITEQSDRPLLLNEQGEVKDRQILKDEMQQLYRQRLPLYEQAELHIQSKKYRSVEELVNSIIKKIRNHVSHR